MARINFEDSILTDPRFADLIRLTGSLDCAYGALIRVWLIGQRFYLKGDGLIPHDEWKKNRLSDHVIAVGLAERREEGIWVRGSHEQFGWLKKCQESGKVGGQNSAKNRAKKSKGRGSDPSKNDENSKGSQGSYSYSNSYSSSDSNSDSKTKQKNGADKSTPAPGEVKEVIGKYCDAWKLRWKATATITGKDSGIIKRLVSDVGKEKAIILVESYCEMPDSWFVEKRHDLGTLSANLSKVTHFAQTRRMISRKEIRELDHAVSQKTLMDQIQAGDI